MDTGLSDMFFMANLEQGGFDLCAEWFEMFFCYHCAHSVSFKTFGILAEDGKWDKTAKVNPSDAEDFEYFLYIHKCPKCNSADIEMMGG